MRGLRVTSGAHEEEEKGTKKKRHFRESELDFELLESRREKMMFLGCRHRHHHRRHHRRLLSSKTHLF
jgi:hypothetical protein